MDFLNSSDTEVAAYVLHENKVPMYYKDLIMEVLEKRQKNVQALAEAISEVYTQLNMDSRFHYEGEGKWGLTEWRPPETKRSSRGARSAASNKAKTERQREEKLFEGIQEDN